ncbi:hypothetical protein MMC24_006022 [Lignoscripta atroalba]|nr:hypothetical protein [Lignoscripta atroalba]
MAEEACCTCASLLSKIPLQYDEKTEKPVAQDRRLDCCGRVICGRCISKNDRFATYCSCPSPFDCQLHAPSEATSNPSSSGPFCQITSTPSSLPQGLRDPPAYSSPPPSPRPSHATLAHPPDSDLPPSYSSIRPPPLDPQPNSSTPVSDTIHHLHPSDTLTSLSLAYNVPIPALRAKNALYADHLLAARRKILIPQEYYQGESLSPKSVVGEEEEERRSKVRRWMVGCKVAEYDIALLYLKQADYNLDAAIEAYKADEKWERDHPMDGASVKGKAKQGSSTGTGPGTARRRFGAFGVAGQLS